MARPLTVTKVKGTIGHTLVRHERGRYNIYKCFEPNKYRKIGETFNYDETIPYRNLEFSNKGRKGKKANLPVKPLPIPKTPAPKKVVQTMEATLKAKDKVLERIARNDTLVIAEQSRPQKVKVVIDSKTTIEVYPHLVEGAVQRYNQRYRQSQEQANTKQRAGNIRPAARVKETKSETIYAY